MGRRKGAQGPRRPRRRQSRRRGRTCTCTRTFYFARVVVVRKDGQALVQGLLPHRFAGRIDAQSDVEKEIVLYADLGFFFDTMLTPPDSFYPANCFAFYLPHSFVRSQYTYRD